VERGVRPRDQRRVRFFSAEAELVLPGGWIAHEANAAGDQRHRPTASSPLLDDSIIGGGFSRPRCGRVESRKAAAYGSAAWSTADEVGSLGCLCGRPEGLAGWPPTGWAGSRRERLHGYQLKCLSFHVWETIEF